MTQLCEKAQFQHLVTAGNCYQIRPDGEDGEHEISRVCPETTALAAVPAGTITGPITYVHIVKVLDEYGLEVAIPSICRPGDIT